MGKRVPKIPCICEECGETFEVLPSTFKSSPCRFCSRLCANRWIIKHSENHKRARNHHKAPWLRKLNLTPGRNKKIAIDNRHKNRATHVKKRKNNGKTYAKFYGRHEHRVVAEQMLGRDLKPDEIVHHIDNDKRNNDPSNLQIMNQVEHARLHAIRFHAEKERR